MNLWYRPEVSGVVWIIHYQSNERNDIPFNHLNFDA